MRVLQDDKHVQNYCSKSIIDYAKYVHFSRMTREVSAQIKCHRNPIGKLVASDHLGSFKIQMDLPLDSLFTLLPHYRRPC